MPEETLLQALARRLPAWAASKARTHDFATADGRGIVQIKQRVRARRDVLATAVDLAQLCARSPDVQDAYLVLLDPRLSAPTLKRLWGGLRGTLRPEIFERLRLVCVWTDGGELLLPADGGSHSFAEAIRETAADQPEPAQRMDRSYEVAKVLLRRRLLGEGRMRVAELQAETGLSYPTVARDLAALKRHLTRHSDRSVELRSLPTETWNAMCALGGRLRDTRGYDNATGRATSLARFVRRLKEAAPPHVAVGGVLGARHWRPDIDIDGLPRIDLCVHAPSGQRDLTFLERVDPALEPVEQLGQAPVVVHTLLRAEPHFVEGGDGLRVADPIEILLDLDELGLAAQAREVLRAWRLP